MVDVDAVAAELYGLRPEEFTAARDARAAAARKAGQRAEAQRIAALHRPTRAVWAANRLARADADQARHLLEIGQGLREAHRTLSGEDLRKLSHQQHVVIAAMAGEARRLAGEAGEELSAGVQREVEQILRSVLADPGAAEAWARGVLAKAPPQAVGFAEVAPEPGVEPRPPQHEPEAEGKPKAGRKPKAEPEPESEPESEPEPDAGEAERTSREAALAEQALARAETEREQARTGLGALDEEIGRLEERLERARAERERLAAVAENAERRHREAEREAKAARAAARKARRR
ncbi:hypothetical protein [Streptomyces sp. A0592]|uniref:hypothetical protein n=1 Tax=Streptomyces sp. A0592 TaxID=2563099 RepID=UPI00109E694F|nr:hypothetical protein [Streptomyces sp. A0592]THA86964.1 hypothetical protein E6U81_02555 [Streptomyces sp. A0592]